MLVGREKSRFWANIWLQCVLLTLLPAMCCKYDAVGSPCRKLWHIAGSKRRCLLMEGKDGEMFMTRSFNITPKTTEQHLIACIDKSVAYVTNNKRLCSTFCIVEDNYWQTRSIARPLCDCDSRATGFMDVIITHPFCTAKTRLLICFIYSLFILKSVKNSYLLSRLSRVIYDCFTMDFNLKLLFRQWLITTNIKLLSP